MIRKKLIAGVIGALILSSQVSADFASALGGYNVVTFGSFAGSNDQIHGSLAAGGNVDLGTSYGVGVDQQYTTVDALVSGGDVNLNGSGQVFGSVAASGKITKSSEFTILGSSSTGVDVNTIYDFADAKAELQEISDYYATLEGSSGVKHYGAGITFTGEEGAELNVFTITAEELNTIQEFKFENIDSDAFNVINVVGDNVKFEGPYAWGSASFMGDIKKTNAGNFLWNLNDAKNVSVSSLYGNLLATGANGTSTSNGGEIWGKVVFNTYSGENEFHDANPPPTTTDVPESSAAVMILMGACALVMASKKKIALLKK